jgi:hypothetical protein
MIKGFISGIISWLVMQLFLGLICWLIYDKFLVNSFNLELGYIEWTSIVIIASILFPHGETQNPIDKKLKNINDTNILSFLKSNKHER